MQKVVQAHKYVWYVPLNMYGSIRVGHSIELYLFES